MEQNRKGLPVLFLIGIARMDGITFYAFLTGVYLLY